MTNLDNFENELSEPAEKSLEELLETNSGSEKNLH